MSFNIVRAVARAENNDEVHLGRLLLLLLAFGNRRVGAIEGLTKLAKLDFLLRYPNCLERALDADDKDKSIANVQDYERTTIESKMIRFKYGPWDSRYRRWLSLLESRGLVNVHARGRTVYIEITEFGRQVARQFSDDKEYHDLSVRSHIVVKAFGSMTASKIKDFVYEVFPELESLRWGDDIVL